MSRARRMKEREHKGMSKILKYFLILLMLIVIVFFILFYLVKTNKIAFLSGFFDNLKFSDVVKNVSNQSNSDEISNAKTNTITKKSEKGFLNLSDSSTVLDSDNLISSGISITKSNENYMISTTIKNNSKKKINNLKLTLHLYNSEENEISTFNFSIDTISKNSKSTLFTVSNLDLSKAIYYTLNLNTKK